MKLTRFLRRYSRILLMVFMSLLLVVFLIGDVVGRAARQRENPKRKVGQAFGKDIYTTDLDLAKNKQTILGWLGFQDSQFVDHPLDMYLLLEEARRLGVQLGREQAKAILPRLGVTPERLRFIQQRTDRSYDWIYDLAAEWLGVEELVAVQAAALGPSLPRAELAFRDEHEEAQVLLSVLDANAFIDSIPPPTEEELAAFFEETKSRPTSHTEDELRFGYLLPDRVRVEYLTVDPRQVEPKIRIREADAERFYRDYAANYRKPAAPPQTQPGETRPATEFVTMTYEEARERVRRDFRTHKAIEEAQRLIDEIQRTAYQPWQAQPRDEHGFHQPLPESAVVRLSTLKERFSDRYPVEYAQTELLDRSGLMSHFDPRPPYIRDDPELGRANSPAPFYIEGAREIPIWDLAMRVKGLFTPDPRDTSPVLCLLEPSPLLHRRGTDPGTRQKGFVQGYIFCVTEVAPSGPPETLAEVRDGLVEDWRLLKAYALAGQYAEKLAARAREVGLTAAIEEFQELRGLLAAAEQTAQPVGPFPRGTPPPLSAKFLQLLGPTQPSQPFTRNGRSVDWIGQTQKVQRQTFALAQADPAAGVPVAVVPVANQFRWVIVQLQSIKPIYASEFDQQRRRLLAGPTEEEWARLLAEWLSPRSIRQRCGFQPLTTQPIDESAEPF